MTGLRERIDGALDEARTLILVSEVMLGFHYRAVFEPAFHRLPLPMRQLELAGLVLMLAALALLALPAADHRLAERGRDTREFERLTSRAITIALVPFGASLAVSVYMAASLMAGHTTAVALAASVLLLALFLWFGLALMSGAHGMTRRDANGSPRIIALPRSARVVDIDHKVHEVLTETRLVLPGAQALLGFQLSVTLMAGFEQVSGVIRTVTLWSFASIALSTILLMAPSAYHRIAERGENTERFLSLASRLLIAAMVALALALTGNTFVAVAQITGSTRSAAVAAVGTAAGFFGLWFVFPMLRRGSVARERGDRVRKEARS